MTEIHSSLLKSTAAPALRDDPPDEEEEEELPTINTGPGSSSGIQSVDTVQEIPGEEPTYNLHIEELAGKSSRGSAAGGAVTRSSLAEIFTRLWNERDRGSVVAYSATSTDRAQQTLDSLLFELNRLAQGVQQDELDRLKAQIKSSLIMQQESSYSRSGTIAGDMYYLGRVRTIDEISAIIDGLTCDTINTYLAEHPPRDFTIVTLGARELKVPA